MLIFGPLSLKVYAGENHFGHFIASNTSSGVILISQDMSISEAIEGLILIWWATEAEEWINRISRLPL